MVIPKCRVCKSLDWVEAWAGVLRCNWCGALLSLGTGKIVKCADLHRPVVKDEALEEVSGQELEKMLTAADGQPVVSVGLVRPEGWH